MRIEVDQGITKIGDTKGPTYVALTNGEQRVIIIPAKVKREVLAVLRKRGDFKSAQYYRFFTIALFLLLEPYLSRCTEILIDNEYEGHQAVIKNMFLGYVDQFTTVDRNMIKHMFAIVPLPSKNPADQLIHRVHKNKTPEVIPQVFHTKDILKYF